MAINEKLLDQYKSILELDEYKGVLEPDKEELKNKKEKYYEATPSNILFRGDIAFLQINF
jgi:hypothetical protein